MIDKKTILGCAGKTGEDLRSCEAAQYHKPKIEEEELKDYQKGFPPDGRIPDTIERIHDVFHISCIKDEGEETQTCRLAHGPKLGLKSAVDAFTVYGLLLEDVSIDSIKANNTDRGTWGPFGGELDIIFKKNPDCVLYRKANGRLQLSCNPGKVK